MSFWQKLKYLLPSYRAAQERDMSEELQSLAAMAETGELGNLTRAAEGERRVWRWTWLDHLYRDVNYAFRSMRHNIGFTAIAVLSLALGIGANTAIYSFMDAIMMRALPVPDPQKLVVVNWRAKGNPKVLHEQHGDGLTFPYPAFELLRDHNDALSAIFAFAHPERL